jgi:hypothetical protein
LTASAPVFPFGPDLSALVKMCEPKPECPRPIWPDGGVSGETGVLHQQDPDAFLATIHVQELRALEGPASTKFPINAGDIDT